MPEAQAAARDAQHDMQAAVRYARAHADELGIDPDKIAVGGSSAGGIIALMTAFNEATPGNSGNPGYPSGVAAAVSHAGAYVPILQGAFPLPGAPPIAIYHGTTDNQVPIPTSIPGCVLTIAVGNTCEYVAYVGRIHRTMGTDLALNFLYRHVIIGPELRVPLVLGPGMEDEDPDVRAVGWSRDAGQPRGRRRRGRADRPEPDPQRDAILRRVRRGCSRHLALNAP